jgi:hypothetical protein
MAESGPKPFREPFLMIEMDYFAGFSTHGREYG